MARLIRVNFGLREIDTFLNRRLGGALMQFVGWYVHWILTNFEFAFTVVCKKVHKIGLDGVKWP